MLIAAAVCPHPLPDLRYAAAPFEVT